MAKKFHSFLWGFWKTDKKIQQASEGQLPIVGGSDKDKMLHTNSSTGAVEWSNDYIKKSIGTQIGDMLVYNGSAWKRLNSGYNGTVLTSGGGGSGSVEWTHPAMHRVTFTHDGHDYVAVCRTDCKKFSAADSTTLSTWMDFLNAFIMNEMQFLYAIRKTSNAVDCVYYRIDNINQSGVGGNPELTIQGYYLSDGAQSMPVINLTLSTAVTDERTER